eukprot:g57160.t1
MSESPAKKQKTKTKEESVLRVVAFGSGSGSNIEALLKAQPELKSFKIKTLFTDRGASNIPKIGKAHNIPCLYANFVDVQKKANQDGVTKADEIRELYFEAISALLEAEAQPFDLIVLAGFMRIVPPGFIRKYPKMINVHPSDLRFLDEKTKQRKYVGMHAVADALKAGEKTTRSTVHGVTEGVDAGPLVVVGPPVEWTGKDFSDEEVDKHQQKQKENSDWPALVTAVDRIARGFKVGKDAPIVMEATKPKKAEK